MINDKIINNKIEVKGNKNKMYNYYHDNEQLK